MKNQITKILKNRDISKDFAKVRKQIKIIMDNNSKNVTFEQTLKQVNRF